MGPSGSGKSTLLHCAAGLDRPDSGSVTLVDVDLRGRTETQLTELRREHVAFVFQSSVLLPWRTVLANVLLPVEVRHFRLADWTDKAMDLLRLTGLTDFAHHYPRELSGGMRQRAAICRALLMDPDVLMMDEPFGALDAMTRDTMNEELSGLWRRSGKTIVFVTHDIAEAVRLGTEVAVMSARPGRIERIVETGFTARDEYADRIASVRFLEKVQELRAIFLAKARSGR